MTAKYKITFKKGDETEIFRRNNPNDVARLINIWERKGWMTADVEIV